MKSIAILSALFSLIIPASARLGETRTECIARYGEPAAGSTERATVFTKAGFRIGVIFKDGKAEALQISKVETDVLGNSTPMTEAEIETILRANGSGKEWKRVSGLIMDKDWQTEDSSAIANYSASKNILGLYLKAFVDRSAAEVEAKEKKNLEGF